MYLPNSASQGGNHPTFRADGTITALNTAQLVLPQATSRAMLMIMNTSASAMYVEHGPARAKATITNGSVTGVTIINGGFGYTVPPIVEFQGGGGNFVASGAWNGIGLRNIPAPNGAIYSAGTFQQFARPATGHAVLTGGVVTSIVIDDPGAGYINPPEVVLYNAPNDPFGCADPHYGGANSGILLAANGGSYYINGTACWTDAIAVSGTASATFYLEYMP